MCIVAFMWQHHPLYPFVLLSNRDEYYSRPTEPLSWWEGGEILGGRDKLAGGTWLASSRKGRVAFLTNVREVGTLPQPKTRGELPVRFLESKKSPIKFAKEVVEEAHQYNGFNSIVTDMCSKTMIYITNRPNSENDLITHVSPGIHVLSNASLNSPWPKAQRLNQSFRELLKGYGTGELPLKDMVEKLMMDTCKDDEGVLPKIYSPRREYHLSSIFVDTDLPLGRYGTRSMSALSVNACGQVRFFERYLDNDLWKEQTVTYEIDKSI